MASVVTTLGDVINPQVMGDMIEAKIDAQAKFIPYAHVDKSLEGTPGDTKTVPSWNYIGDAEDFDPEEGKEMETSKLTASSATFSVKCAAKSVSVYQTAVNSGLGDPIGQAGTQLAKAIVQKVDNDVIDASYTTKNKAGDGTAVIGYSGVVDAVCQFEDEEDGIEKVMFIHPRQEAILLKDPDFLSADKFTNGVAVNGSIGKIAGCWIKKSKKVRLVKYKADAAGTITIVDDASDESETELHIASVAPYIEGTVKVGDTVEALTEAYYCNPIIKLQPDSSETEYTEDELPALTIYLKKDTQVDAEWLPKRQRHDITAAKYYGVALTNAAKVVVAKFKE